jgi:hypothetical protein
MQLDSLTQSAAIIFVVIGFVWIFIPLITDLAVRQSILSAKDVESTHVQASFWL